jgi:hypothetical protein
MTKLFIVAAAALAVMAVPAAADTDQWGVSGSGRGTGAVAGDRVDVGAHSDPGGGNVVGHVENQFTLITTQFNDGGEAVCLRVADHRAVVVYRFRRPVTVPELPGRVYRYGAAYIEDNGDPVDGQPVDRMLDFAVREVNLHFFCEADPATFFDAALAEPISSGNFVVQGD